MRRVPSFFHSPRRAGEKSALRIGRLDFSPFDLRIEPVSQDMLQALADKHPELASISTDLRASMQWAAHDSGAWCVHERRQSHDRRELGGEERRTGAAGPDEVTGVTK